MDSWNSRSERALLAEIAGRCPRPPPDVPTTVADGRAVVVSAAPEADYVEAIVRAAG